MVAGWEFGELGGLGAEMGRWYAGYLGKEAQVGWGMSHGFGEWMERAGIFGIRFTSGKNPGLFLANFKSKKLDRI